MIHEGNPLNSGSLECLQVAGVDYTEPASPRFVYTEAFAKEDMPLENITSITVINELARYAQEHDLHGEIRPVKEGEVFFDDLDHGLYLIRQKDEIDGILPIEPFLISIPQYDEEKDIYTYNVTAFPKASFVVRPPEPDKPDDPDKPDHPDKPDQPDKPEKPKDETPQKPAPKENPKKDPKKPGTGTVEQGRVFTGLCIAALGVLTVVIKRKISED